jgi:hypothetical protein
VVQIHRDFGEFSPELLNPYNKRASLHATKVAQEVLWAGAEA